MIKKAKKLWSKKLKAAIISLSLGLAVALGGAVAAISISANKKNLGGTLADGVASENVAYTFKKGGTAPSGSVTYKTQEEAWNAAVQYSVDSGKKVGFDLTENWVAQPYNTQIVTERVFYNITMVAPQTIPSSTGQASHPILLLTNLQSAMFLLNSRLGLSSATLFCSSSK